MVIGVVSDTHCIERYINLAIDRLKDVDMILHLGDCSSDIKKFEEKLNKKIYGVDGNCDFRGEYPKELILQANGKKIFLTHGDIYGVKNNLNNIYYRGKELGVDIILYGHSHIEVIENQGDMLIMNPGSTSIPKGRGHSMGFIEIDKEGNIKPRIEYLIR